MGEKKLDITFAKMTGIFGDESYCKNAKVGAIIVKDGNIISTGYNGTISGFPNVCELENGTTNHRITLHAESNAIAKLACSTQSCEGATIYTSLSPCIDCAKLIIQSKIKRLVYTKDYRITDGLELLAEAGIEIVRLNLEE